MKCAFLYMILIFPRFLSAQKHDNIWMGGNYDNFYIDFNQITPSIHTVNSSYVFIRTMNFLSDKNGNPAFYSNGCSIRNASHQLLVNGELLLPNDSSCSKKGYMTFAHSGGVTLPDFSPDKYIIFSNNSDIPVLGQPCENNRLTSHYLDIGANNGVGKVTEKDKELLLGCFQEPTANRNANGRDWWILVPDNQQNKFYRWLLTPYGLKGPWEQIINNPTVDGYWYCGWSEFSPNGSKYLINSCRTGVVVYDFDRCNGLLSNAIFLNRSTQWNFGATFSPDNQLLYTVDTISNVLLQYNLEADSVTESRDVISTWDGTIDSFMTPSIFGYMQHGPDGKIYIWGGGSSLMHVIDFPNRLRSDCKVRQHAIELPGISAGGSLYYPNYRLGPIDNSSCDTLGINNLPIALFRYDLEDTLNPFQVTFTDVSSYEPTSWHWDFGDGSTSQDTSPVHTYALPGAYEVCLTVSNAYAADTFCRQVLVGISGIHELPALPQLHVYPNPFSESVTLQLPAQLGVKPVFELSDLYGRVIRKISLEDFETQLDLKTIPAGVYVWHLYWNGMHGQGGKLVKVE